MDLLYEAVLLDYLASLDCDAGKRTNVSFFFNILQFRFGSCSLSNYDGEGRVIPGAFLDSLTTTIAFLQRRNFPL